jgi:hypothetical protein
MSLLLKGSLQEAHTAFPPPFMRCTLLYKYSFVLLLHHFETDHGGDIFVTAESPFKIVTLPWWLCV